MQKGFSYLQALLVFSLSLLLFSSAYLVLQGTLRSLEQPAQIVSPLLDMLSTDLQFATKVAHTGSSLTITTTDDQYRYALLNKRLARLREGILYLSPATPNITTFSVSTTDEYYYTLTLATPLESETRIVRRRN